VVSVLLFRQGLVGTLKGLASRTRAKPLGEAGTAH
jgi:hypothetical protein